MEQQNLQQAPASEEALRIKKRNLVFYPLGTVGRDMVYNLFTNFILLYILYTKGLDTAQLGVVTAIMVAARVFDALNDPIMGNIIESTRTRWGKFKPWLLAGVLSTSVVVYLAFNTSLTGWSFVIFFGVIYFLYSITFTMNDISYWGMVAALSEDTDSRNQFTSRATLFAGIGGTLASLLIPIFTAGEHTIGGSASIAYGRIALVICILSPLFILFTLIGTRENRDITAEKTPRVSFKKIIGTIFGNEQLRWMILIFLFQQIGNSLVLGGIGSSYIYFRYGYEGGLFSTFSTIGVAATAFLMLFYPMISRKLKRKVLMKYLLFISFGGFALQLVSGLVMPAGMPAFWVLTLGYMLSAFGQYGFYLIMMISIINTVEYNEYTVGTRDEAIITSMRPLLTKMGSAVVVMLTSLTYVITNVLTYTNQIAELEQQMEQKLITEPEKIDSIAAVIAKVQPGQTTGLLIAMVLIPLVFTTASYFLYQKFYTLDEDRYEEICGILNERRKEAAET
ncbi:MAG: MFS transporter [Lachnospiraceae bacterium]|nr:MFS transporter [Lachnospiraceae bacterium]MBP5254936.1 MFS transporter [Lachnospiraceae bacterium]